MRAGTGHATFPAMKTGYRLQFENMGWRGKLGAIVATALGLAAAVVLVVLSLGLALILIPVVAIAFLVARWRFGKMMAEARRQSATWQETAPSGDGQTIEIDYTVIDNGDSGTRRR